MAQFLEALFAGTNGNALSTTITTPTGAWVQQPSSTPVVEPTIFSNRIRLITASGRKAPYLHPVTIAQAGWLAVEGEFIIVSLADSSGVSAIGGGSTGTDGSYYGLTLNGSNGKFQFERYTAAGGGYTGTGWSNSAGSNVTIAGLTAGQTAIIRLSVRQSGSNLILYGYLGVGSDLAAAKANFSLRLTQTDTSPLALAGTKPGFALYSTVVPTDTAGIHLDNLYAFSPIDADITTLPTGVQTTLQLTSTRGNWTGGTFTLSGGTGASIVSQTINSATSATVVIQPGSAAGSLTLLGPLGAGEGIDLTVTNVSVSVAPSNVNVVVLGTQQFAATVAGTGNQSGAWSVPSAAGAISSTGLFTAGTTPGTYTVTFVSAADTSKSGTAQVIVVAETPPSAPTITKSVAGDNVSISVTEASTPGSNAVAFYDLRFGTLSGGQSNVAVATLAAGAALPASFPAQPAANAPGETFFWIVVARTATGAVSAPSNEVSSKKSALVPSGQTHLQKVRIVWGSLWNGIGSTLTCALFDSLGAPLVNATAGFAEEVDTLGTYVYDIPIDDNFDVGTIVFYAPAGSGLEAQSADIVPTVDGLSLVEANRAMLAMLVGLISGAETATPIIKNPAGTKTRVSMTTDGNGNRSAVILDVTP